MTRFESIGRLWPGVALAAALLAVLPAAGAASAADDRYQAERAACLQRPDTDHAACLREAAAARQAARAGKLNGGDAYETNRLRRCDALPAADRDACIRRARDEGTVSGSVEGGGILREYREVILPPVPPAPPPAAPAPPATAVPVVPVPPAPPVVPAPVPAQPAPAGVMLERVQ